ncbi:MAG: hypothetical protein IJ485_00585 [Lachnospiraceae bacterium]|nr:hypothetical protein [Lachnospiraceae bacterium]
MTSNSYTKQEEVTVLQLFSRKKSKTNKELIEQIILEKYNQYYRLAYSYAHNEADASDIVQNGAYKALRSSHTLKEQEFASTWVYRIMLNECFSYARQPKHVSYENILDENVSTIKSRLYRGLKKLRIFLADEVAESVDCMTSERVGDCR